MEAFEETIWARVIASQKLSRDNGESIFAARHQDVSQGPLGWPAQDSNKSRENPNLVDEEVRPFFLSDTSTWSLPSVSFLCDYCILEVLKAILALRS